MTEISYLWDGIVTGDAAQAPYDKNEFNKFMFLVQSTDNVLNTAYVVPGYLNDLRIFSNESSMQISVAAGAAVLGSRYIYMSDAEVNLVIEGIQTAGYFRYDYVILRIDVSAQKVRLDILKGVETNNINTLVPPTTSQNTLIREIPLAKIFIDDTTSYVQDRYIEDLREFTTNAINGVRYPLINKNLIVNSEFLAYSSSDGVVGPEGWYQGSATVSSSTKQDEMSRGRSLNIISTGNGIVLRQIVPVDSQHKTFSLKYIFYAPSEIDGEVTFSIYPGTTDYLATTRPGEKLSGTHKQQTYAKVKSQTTVIGSFTITLDDNTLFDNAIIDIRMSNGAVINLGQVILIPGYHAGPFREFNETIMLRERLTGTNWSDTAKSSGTTTIDANAEFGIPMRTKGLYVRVRGRDSGSAGGTASISLQGYAAPYNTIYGSVDLSGITNDVYREATFFVPTDAPIYNAQDETPQFRAVVVATGASTFDATLEIVGIVV